MNTKRIGNIGEAKVLAKFVELNIPVYLPFGDNEKVDIIADFNGKLNRIQVKTSIKAENGVMIFDLTSSTIHRKHGNIHIYDSSEIDYFACYNIARDKIFLVDVSSVSKTSITIRFTETKNNQTLNVKYENEFLIDNVLCVETLHEAPKSNTQGEDKVQTTM